MCAQLCRDDASLHARFSTIVTLGSNVDVGLAEKNERIERMHGEVADLRTRVEELEEELRLERSKPQIADNSLVLPQSQLLPVFIYAKL